MLKFKSPPDVIALSIEKPLGVAATALATKQHAHLTYEQAYALCKVHVDTRRSTRKASVAHAVAPACTCTATGSEHDIPEGGTSFIVEVRR